MLCNLNMLHSSNLSTEKELRNLSMHGVKAKNHLRIVYTYDLRMIFSFALFMNKFFCE